MHADQKLQKGIMALLAALDAEVARSRRLAISGVLSKRNPGGGTPGF
jgi:hypothetical protein